MRQETELRPYQDRIATHLYQNDEALCVVRPGYGKTISALTAIRELIRDRVVRMALVVAPKRVANNVWPDEIKAWEHTSGMDMAVLSGDLKQRRAKLDRAVAVGVDIIVIGIDNIAWLIEELDEFPDSFPADHPIFDLLVIDEISKLRNPTGVRAKLLAKHAHRWRMIWGLSGTLRPSSALDLFMPARVVTRGKLWGRSFYQWRQARFYPTDYKGYVWEPKPGAEDSLNSEIAPLTVTLREDEVLQLPKLNIQLDYIDLPPSAQRAYTTMHKQLMARLEVIGKNVLAANSAVATGKLAQIANGFIYHKEDEKRIEVEAEELHDEKREWMSDIIEQATAPTILVYEFQHDLRMLQELVPGLPFLGAGISDKAARAAIDAWNAGSLPFLGLHPASGGHGLNLQKGGADMAWVGPIWSPEYWEQTIARLFRSGQTKPVVVRVCVARNTVDQMKIDRVHFKMTDQAAFEKYLKQRQQMA